MKKGNRKRIGIVISVVLSLCLIPLLLPSATQAACVPPPSGLISWWPGDGNATDIVGGANGILQGGATTAPGLVGQAFSLNGVSASVPTPLILPLVGTIECWVNLASLTQSSSILSIAGTFGTAGGNDRLWISVYGPAGFAGIEQNTFVVNAGDRFVDAISVPYPWPVGVWKHIAVTFDYVSAVYQLYIDGAFQTSAAGQRTAPTGNFQIGAASSDFYPTFFFPGLIDEVSLYSRVLSASEIQAIYNAGSAGKCKVPDSDGDGVPDTEDSCPSSDLAATVVIGDCDSHVLNTLFPNGCTISDNIQQCVEGANNHGNFVSCVSHYTTGLKEMGAITGRQHGAIQSCTSK